MMKRQLSASKITKKAIIYTIIILVSITTVFPYLWMLSTSFKRGKDIFTEGIELIPKVWEFSNYSKVLFDTELIKGFYNTAKIFVFVLPIGLFTTSLAAFAFAKMRFRGKNIVFAVALSTMMIPFPVVMMPQYLFFAFMGMRDSYLPLILPGCLGNISAMFFMVQYLKGTPNALIESAKVDGASYFRIYWQIILPLIKAAVATQGIFWFMAIWNDLLGPIIYLDSVERYPITPLLASINTQSTDMSQITKIMAGSVLASFPLLIIYIIFQKQIIESIALSGVKG